MNSLINPPSAIGQILLLSFLKDGFCIQYPMKVYMPLYKETKPNQSIQYRYVDI